MKDDLESRIQAKQIELAEAQKNTEKYSAIVPLSVSPPIGHSLSEMKRDYDRFDRVYEEYMSLRRQAGDAR